MKKFDDNKYNTLEKSWNDAILEGCVLPCYIRFILRRVDEICGQHEKDKARGVISKFYENFPDDSESKDDYWKSLTHKFYKVLY